MIAGIADSTVVVHLFRRNRAALAWVRQHRQIAIVSITWLELIDGAHSKKTQIDTLRVLNRFRVLMLTDEDQRWAMGQFLAYRLTSGVSLEDCLSASVAHRLQVPLYTHNIRDMLTMLDAALVVQPYEA